MIKQLTIKGVTLPYKLTLGAQRRFDERFKSEGISVLKWARLIDKIEIRHLIALHYEGLKSGCSLEGVEFTMTEDEFADHVTLDDLTDLSDEMKGEFDIEKKT